MDSKLLKRCMSFTFLFGIVAHAYGFFNFTISHDSLEALYSGAAETEWKISLGRIFVPVYRAVTRGMLTTPWMIGMLALVWIGLSVYFIVQLLGFTGSKFLIALTAGILTVNPVVTALTATFLHDLDVDMFALLLMVLAVCLWKERKKGIFPGMCLIAVGLGLYQSYLSVAIALMMIVCIKDLLEGKRCNKVLLAGGKGILLLSGGGLFYLILMEVICYFTGIPLSDSYNSISQLGNLSGSISELFWGTLKAYYYWLMYFLNPASMYSSKAVMAVNLLLGICAAGIILTVFTEKKLGIAEKLLLVCLGGLLPLGMNLSSVLSGGMLHGLMMYSFCLIYLLALFLGAWRCQGAARKGAKVARYVQIAMMGCVAFVIWNGIPVANAGYLKKDLERQQTLSLMTRVVMEMDKEEEYKRGETTVAFVGKIDMREMPGFETFSGNGNTSGVQGLTETDQIKNYRDYEAYFRYILNVPVKLCTEEQRLDFWNRPEVEAMPVFPAEGSIEMVDGMMVIKMGEEY